MRKNDAKKKTFIIILLIVVLVIISIYLIKKHNNAEKAVTSEPQNNLSSNNDLKNIKEEESKIEESVDDDGNRKITITNSDGTTNTITISKEYDGSGVSQTNDLLDTGDHEDVPSEEPKIKPEEPKTTFEEYSLLSSEDQYKFYKTFSSTEDFIVWYNEAKAEYEKANPSIEIGEGDIIHFGEE